MDLGRIGSQDELWVRISIIAVLLAQGLCLSLIALSTSRERQDKSLNVLLGLIVLAPACIGTLLIIFASFEARSQEEYWAVAPWIPISFAVRFVFESVVAAALASAAYKSMTLSDGQKLAALGLLCVGLMVWVTVNIKTKPPLRETGSSFNTQREDSLAAARYVRVAPEALKLVTPPLLVETSYERKEGQVMRYLVEVRSLDIDGPRRYVVVDATHRGSKLKLSWACVLGDKHDWVLPDPCNRPEQHSRPSQ